MSAFSTAPLQIAANPGYAGRSDPSTLAKEVVDLSEPDRILMMDLRRQVEHGVREVTQPGKGSVGITAIEPVGHYAIRIVFSDGHDTGMYSWDLLQSFCQNQPRLWDEYLGKLLAAGHPRESGRDASMVKSGGSGCAI